MAPVGLMLSKDEVARPMERFSRTSCTGSWVPSDLPDVDATKP